VDRRVTTASVRTPPSESDATAHLRRQNLHLPVAGIAVDDLHSSFTEKRGGSRQHEAIDILAPRNTPVHAVDDGCIARLFESKAGGITLYQFDPTLTYTYYYAHLERYADEIEEGDALRRGQVIGYVGTSGNAPPGTPHLHFAVFIMGPEKRWWQGTPIDPYEIWNSNSTAGALN
jgi:murein DD-endopeptidase MepM/ murein hydrolase activator NlpD